MATGAFLTCKPVRMAHFRVQEMLLHLASHLSLRTDTVIWARTLMGDFSQRHTQNYYCFGLARGGTSKHGPNSVSVEAALS